MFSEDLQEMKRDLVVHMEKIRGIKQEYPEDISPKNNLRFNNLDFHVNKAFNLINEILNN